MLRQLSRLWNEENGFVVSAELVLIATIVVLALIVGLSVVRTSVTSELFDIANAFGHANQSFHTHGKGGFDGNSFHDDSGHDHDLTLTSPEPE